jgi:hypothetical protein
MSVYRLDDHLPEGDRAAVTLFRREAERLEPGRGPELDAVLASGRRRLARRRLAALGAAAAVAGVTVVSALAADTGRGAGQVLPAGPGPTVTTKEELRSPSDLYRATDEALADAGLATAGRMRWSSTSGAVFAGQYLPRTDSRAGTGGIEATQARGLPVDGLRASGFWGVVVLPGHGAELEVKSLRLAERAPADADYCGWFTLTDRGTDCRAEATDAGLLVTLSRTARSARTVVLVQDRSVVFVSSDVSSSGDARGAADPAPLPLPVLADLASDPRLQW